MRRGTAGTYLWLAIGAFIIMGSGRLAAGSPDGGAGSSQPRRVIVPRLAGAVTIDGLLDEPVWQQAAKLKPFVPNSGRGADSEATEVRVWYDGEALHIGWLCDDRDIQATMSARDSRFWEEEVAEFFLAPTRLDEYFELQWNPLGGIFDAIIRNQIGADGKSVKFTGDWSYTAKRMRAAVRVDGTVANSGDQDRGWIVEAVVPFSDLGVGAPEPGTVWRGNFYRFSRGKNDPEQQLAWSPTRLRGFHEPTRFGYLEFGK